MKYKTHSLRTKDNVCVCECLSFHDYNTIIILFSYILEKENKLHADICYICEGVHVACANANADEKKYIKHCTKYNTKVHSKCWVILILDFMWTQAFSYHHLLYTKPNSQRNTKNGLNSTEICFVWRSGWHMLVNYHQQNFRAYWFLSFSHGSLNCVLL